MSLAEVPFSPRDLYETDDPHYLLVLLAFANATIEKRNKLAEEAKA